MKTIYRDQNQNFIKKTGNKFDNNYGHYRPSISYIEAKSNKDNDFTQMQSGVSIALERSSVFARR